MSLVGLLIGLLWILIYGLVGFGIIHLILWVAGLLGFPLPEPMPKIMYAILAVILLIMLILLLTGSMPTPIVLR